MYEVLTPLFVVIEPLEDACLPAFVVRKHGMTLIYFDPDALLVELAFWAQENLTDPERIVLREAYGHSPDLTRPPTDALLNGRVGRRVPVQLRLPGSSAPEWVRL